MWKVLKEKGGSYPEKFAWPDKTHHLLFDVGFTFACLFHTRRLFTALLADPGFDLIDPVLQEEIKDLLEKLESLNRGRLQDIDTLYAVAPDALSLLERLREIGSSPS